MRRSTIVNQRSCTWAALVVILCASIGACNGLVTIVDGAQAGTSVPIFSGGGTRTRDLPSGTITLTA